MRYFFILLFLLVAFRSTGQFDYELYKYYAEAKMRELNKGVTSAALYELQDDGAWMKASEDRYNTKGLPVSITSFMPGGKINEKKEFTYDAHGYLKQIDTYKPDHYDVMYRNGIPDSTKTNEHTEKCIFENNLAGQITSYTDYVYSSIGNDSSALWKTLMEYYPNKKISKNIMLSGSPKDTDEIIFFDTDGDPTRTLYKKQMFTYNRVEYVFNDDKSEMKEIKYKEDLTILDTTIHKYVNHLEVEQREPSNGQPIYWKYDNNGRIIETNEALFYVTYFTYDDKGRLKTKTINVINSDSDIDKLPKKVYYKYEYQYRK